MKRSRIFLGATTCLLAIAGVAAAKASHFGDSTQRYYCTSAASIGNDHPLCLPFNRVNCKVQDSGGTICMATISGIPYTLYVTGTTVGTPTCGFNSPNCVTPVKYTTFQ